MLQPGADLAMVAVRRRHPGLFERLAPFAGRKVAILASGLPFSFELRIDPYRPRLRLGRASDSGNADAEIRAPLADLLDLLEGKCDGDALFFSRDLRISGDTAVVVAIRNAVDDCEIDLADTLAGLFGPLNGPARLVLDIGRGLVAQTTADFEPQRRTATP